MQADDILMVRTYRT